MEWKLVKTENKEPVKPEIVMVKEVGNPGRWAWSMTIDGFNEKCRKFPGKFVKVQAPVPQQIVIPKKKEPVVVKKAAKKEVVKKFKSKG